MTCHWRVNEAEYFEAPALSALVFNNRYPEGKQGGVEIIQHDTRVAANGDLRLEIIPGQWDSLPALKDRRIDRNKNLITAELHYPDVDLDYTVRVCPEGEALRVTVDLASPVPAAWQGKVSFNLELFPDAYFGATYFCDHDAALFPRQAGGPMTVREDGILEPRPLGTGRKLTFAPEEPLKRLMVESRSGELTLYDGRNESQNSWFVLREVVPEGKTAGAIDWLILPHAVPGWRRTPVICVSQVGYHPKQVKQAILELDPRTTEPERAGLYLIQADGTLREVLSARPR
ncbi:MAG TPA: glycoside hydrolase, partial [Spirochaetia bacterium]|nr:glycoside hydrolase [Spirochaetia bacterium]